MSTIWKPKSLFLRSEFIFWQEHSQLEDIGDAIVIRTPANPYWRWGHILVLKTAPRMEDVERWRLIYEEKLKPHQYIPNRIIVWDEGELNEAAREAFATDQMTFSSFDVLTLDSLTSPQNQNSEIEIRDLVGYDDEVWQQVIDTNIECFATGNETDDYREYALNRIAHHRAMVIKGLGHWYAAYINGQFAGNLGFFSNDGLCRFQEVAVRPQYRRQGVAASLVYHAAHRGSEEHPHQPQVIVASRTGDAIRVYQGLGFKKHSESQALHERA